MKIKKLHIENYKSLKKVDFRLNNDINVFIGKNNSGKSNLIDALMFLSHIKRGTDIRNLLSEYGGYKEVVFGKDVGNKIAFDLKFTPSDEDIASLFSKLDLASEIPLDEFQKMLNKLGYLIELEENRLLSEEIHIYFHGNDVLYAKGSYRDRDGMYYSNVIENFKDGIKNGRWELVSTGGQSPASSILYISHSPIRPEENLLLLLRDFVSSFTNLAPVRQSRERQSVRGIFQLSPDASNLPQVLNSIAASRRELFEKIMKSVGEIIEEIQEVRAPVVDGTHDTYLSAVEQAFKGKEFTWKHIASGTKEILYLITLLHTTPRGSLLMIEEPEIHLHADAIWKFLSLADKACKEDDKQMMITTHSPLLIDRLPFEKIFTVVKDSGETKVEALREGKGLEDMLFQAGIPKSWLLQRKLPSFLLIVEGRDDAKIWNTFLETKGIKPSEIRAVSSGEPGGGNKDVEVAKFIKRARIPIAFMIIRDSDNKKEKKERELEKEGFKQGEYHVLSKKEIEDYLLDHKTISGITGKSEQEVSEAIKNAKGAGKEKLDNIFMALKLSKPDVGIKELLASRIEIPDEILSVINKIRSVT